MTADEWADWDYERLFRALAEAVERLESGNLSLEEALDWYERGLKLMQACNARLDAADERIKAGLDGGLLEVHTWSQVEMDASKPVEPDELPF